MPWPAFLTKVFVDWLGFATVKAGLIATALTAASVTYSVKSSREQRERLLEQRLKAQERGIRPTAAGGEVLVPYGLTVLTPTRVFGDVSDRLPTAVRDFGSLLPTSRAGKLNEYVLFQHVLSVAGIEGIEDIWFDDESIKTPELSRALAVQFIQSPRASAIASNMATAFSRFRTDADKFTDLAYLTTAYHYDVQGRTGRRCDSFHTIRRCSPRAASVPPGRQAPGASPGACRGCCWIT